MVVNMTVGGGPIGISTMNAKENYTTAHTLQPTQTKHVFENSALVDNALNYYKESCSLRDRTPKGSLILEAIALELL